MHMHVYAKSLNFIFTQIYKKYQLKIASLEHLI